MNNNINFPEELKTLEHLPNDVSIIIGKNGSGKSTLLNELSNYFWNNGKNIIAIANTIHDKFEMPKNRYKILRGRSGRRFSRSIIKNSLKNIAKNDSEIKLKNASVALEYIGFEPIIGFQIINLKKDFERILFKSQISTSDKEKLNYILTKATYEQGDSKDDIIWFRPNMKNFYEFEKLNLVELFTYEAILKKLKIIERIEVFLKKEDLIISLFEASSGELALITTIIYISSTITENTVILIDEPENSLHPLWQKEYSKQLMDLFYWYQPKIIIATHSPIIVNGAEIFVEESKIFKAESFNILYQKNEPLNVEEIYYKFFDITTPENRFLSNRLIRLLNILAENKMTRNEFELNITQIISMSYDERQKKTLNGILELSKKIINYE